MSNKEMIRGVFDEEFHPDQMRQQILSNYRGKVKIKISKIMKYVVFPACLLFVIFMGALFYPETRNSKENNIGMMKVYAYTMSENAEVERKELQENVKLGLTYYNLAMSSVPGYPILFDFNHIDSIHVTVTHGTIFDWNRETGGVESLGNSYQLSSKKTLYFNINEESKIEIRGIKGQKEIFYKVIDISSDDDFNYYAILR